MPVPLPSYFPSLTDLYSARARGLGAQAEERRRLAEQLFNQAQQHMRRAAQMQAPPLQQPVGKNDLLPLLLAGGLAKLLGAKDQDLALGGQGFLQGRQAYAQTANQNAQNAFLGKQHALEVLAQLGQQGSEFQSRRADELSRDQRFAWGLSDKARSDADQQDQQRKLEAAARIGQLGNRLKVAHPSEIPSLAEALNEAYRVAGVPPMSPEAISDMAKERARNVTSDKRSQIYSSLGPFVEESEQAKLAKWLISLGDQELGRVSGLAAPEILKSARASYVAGVQPDPRTPGVKAQTAQVLQNSHLQPEILHDVAAQVQQYPLEFQVRAAHAFASLATPGSDRVSALKDLASIDAAAIRQLDQAYSISQKGLAGLPPEILAQYQQALENLHHISQAIAAVKSPPGQGKPPPLTGRLQRSRDRGGFRPFVIGPSLGALHGAIASGPSAAPTPKRAPNKTGRTPNGTTYKFENY